MTCVNNIDRDQAQRIVGPDFRSILFDTKHQFLLETGCFALNNLNSKTSRFCQFFKLSNNFWRAPYITRIRRDSFLVKSHFKDIGFQFAVFSLNSRLFELSATAFRTRVAISSIDLSV